MAKKTAHPAAQFHHIYLEAVKKQTEPVSVLTAILLEKLREQGIDGSGYLDALKKHAADLWDARNDVDHIVLSLDDDRPEKRSIKIQLNSADVVAVAKKIAEEVEADALEFFEALSRDTLQDILSDPGEQLLYLENQREAFERGLAYTWAVPFNLLEVHTALCGEIGDIRNSWLRSRRRRSKDLVVVDVVTRLHGRAIQVAAEIQALLRGGFADGALSRWRTMHELAVIAMFVAEKGVATAERYLAHLDADSIKAARQYQRFAPALQHKPISARDMKRFDVLAVNLERKYGKPFFGDYGWAADALAMQRPTFADIEEAVDLEAMRPYFRFASNTVHAGAKGTFFRIGLIGDQGGILAGASNAGLDEAGRLTAYALAQVTNVLLGLHQNTDSIVWSRVILALASRVEQQFVKVQRRIEREEKRF